MQEYLRKEKLEENKIININASILKSDLLLLKGRLESIEGQLHEQIKDLEKQEEKWKVMDDQVPELIKNQNQIIRINVSGKIFITKLETLLSIRDTLFYKLILSKKFNLNQELFFDRSSRMFSVLLDYLRYKKICYKRFSRDELFDLRVEADYYEISDVANHLSQKYGSLEIVKFEFSGAYIVGNVPVGTNDLAQINDRSLTKGIVALTPGWITFELNYEFEIEQIEIGGFNGNNTQWGAENGANSTILTSVDKITWVNVGLIPSGFGTSIKTVNLTKSLCKYLKFQSTGYLAIGFLEIKTAG